MKVMLKVMKKLGVDLQNNADIRVLCVGHQLGGDLCSYYAQHLSAVKGVIQLEGASFARYNYLINKAFAMTTEENVADVEGDIEMAKLSSLFSPLYL